jgi:cytochrome c oxidase subunit 3/cytochrome o ubiquinol oxidase subunit 3
MGTLRGRVGMLSLIAAERDLHDFVVAYLFYIGKSLSGPMPGDVLGFRFATICLLSSNLTIHVAVRSCTKADRTFAMVVRNAGPGIFLVETGREWHHLITKRATISTNLFGTTYYSLVGLRFPRDCGSHRHRHSHDLALLGSKAGAS